MTLEERKVFVSQIPVTRKKDGFRPDLSSCEAFGQLLYVFDADDKPWADPVCAAEKARLRLAAENYDPQRDYLVFPFNTDPAGHWIIMAVVAQKTDQIHALSWERRGGYAPILIRGFK